MLVGAPGNAPASKITRARSAVSVPSRLAPVVSSTMAGGAGVVARNSSLRDMTIETGRCTATVRAAASGSSRTNLPPKPPPIGIATTRTRCSGTPSARATCERVKNSACVLVHTVICPTGSMLATAARGSR